MDLNINGVVVSMENTGAVSKGGKEILQANGIKLQDGTTLYIKAYRGEDKKKEISERVSPKIRKASHASQAPEVDMAALIQAAVAKAVATLQVPQVATVKADVKK